jgi:hypothetical protein
MNFEMFEIVVLENDLNEHGLKQGDTGTIVELYEPDGVEIEFLTGSGDTQAVLTLSTSDIRHLSKSDILSVRPLDAA